jgi:hypothetical protein
MRIAAVRLIETLERVLKSFTFVHALTLAKIRRLAPHRKGLLQLRPWRQRVFGAYVPSAFARILRGTAAFRLRPTRQKTEAALTRDNPGAPKTPLFGVERVRSTSDIIIHIS